MPIIQQRSRLNKLKVYDILLLSPFYTNSKIISTRHLMLNGWHERTIVAFNVVWLGGQQSIF